MTSPTFTILVHTSAFIAMILVIALVYISIKLFFDPPIRYVPPLEVYNNEKILQTPQRPKHLTHELKLDQAHSLHEPLEPVHQDLKGKKPILRPRSSSPTAFLKLENFISRPHFLLGRYVHPQASLWSIKYLQAFRRAQTDGILRLVEAEVEADLANGLLGRVRSTEEIPMGDWEGIVWI